MVDNWTTKLSIQWIKKLISTYNYEIKSVFELQDSDFDINDLIILSWWSYLATNPIFDDLKKFIRKYKSAKIIWICLWYQILWLAHDIDNQYINLIKMELELDGIYSDIYYRNKNNIYQNIKCHRLHKRIIQVIKPWLFDILWFSKYGHDIIKYKIYPHIWFSFHPHVYTEKTDWKYIFEEIIRLLSAKNDRQSSSQNISLI